MDKTNLSLGLAVVAIVIAASAVYYTQHHQAFGAAAPMDISATNYTELTANALTVNTSDTATSTTAVGCIQTTATSTATPVRLVLATSGATTTFQGTKAVGVIGWQYGTCPI